jgi:hypothetical protein
MMLLMRKEVHSFTLRTTPAQCRSDTLRHAEHPRTILFMQVGEIRCVRVRNNQHMTRRDRLNVHERPSKRRLDEQKSLQVPRTGVCKIRSQELPS